jgi:ABC-2 type transport system ATP-binding protein
MTTRAGVGCDGGRVLDLVVRTAGLSKRYGARLALDRVELAVRPGEVYGVLGPNGAGKSTLLRILLGLVRPTTGAAVVHGAPAGSRTSLSGVGMLIEDPGLYPYLSGRDNLRIFARYADVPAARVSQVLRTVELTARADDRTSGYSLGMRQRLGVAIALLKDPALLILDEPTNGLDPAGVADIRALLRRLSEEGRTVMLSSHLLSEVQQICDRVGVLYEGRLMHEGTVSELVGKGVVRLRAEPVEQAQRIAERLFGPDRVDTHNGFLLLRIEPDAAAMINRELVLAGVRVQSLTWEQRSLEEVFLKLTSHEPEWAG